MIYKRIALLIVLVLGLRGTGCEQPVALAAGAQAVPSPLYTSPSQIPPLTIETMAVEYTFAQQIAFRLVVRSETPLTSATVFFRAAGGPLHTGLAHLSQSETATHAIYTHDLMGGGLPPFSTLIYWWEVQDAAGHKTVTASQSVDYLDNRFAWHSVAEGILHVHWYEGDSAFGQLALDVARQTLPQLNRDLVAPLPARVDVYIYNRAEELQSALMLAGRPWQGGQARPDLGVVLVAVSPGPDALLQLRHALAHELTHLLVYQATGSGYGHVPRWLDEGWAVLNEPSPDPAYQLTLETAYRQNALLPLETLCAPFPDDARLALLAYSQSLSLVQFIRERYGLESLRALLAAYRDGANCSSGLERALGKSAGAFELEWRASLGPQGVWQAVFNTIGVWIVLVALLLLAPLPLVLGKRKA